MKFFKWQSRWLIERQDITGLNCIKGASGKVIVDDKGIKDSWKEYMRKLMNEENEWDYKLLAEVKEGPADCVKMDEVRASLRIGNQVLYCQSTKAKATLRSLDRIEGSNC